MVIWSLVLSAVCGCTLLYEIMGSNMGKYKVCRLAASHKLSFGDFYACVWADALQSKVKEL